MILSRVVMIRGCTRIAGCVGSFGISVWKYWIFVFHGRVSYELGLSDVSWLTTVMCDTNHDAPLAEDLIISGSLQCIDPDRIATFNSRTGVEFVFKKYEPGMMATSATEKTEPDVTAKPAGTVEECKLACVTNFRASTWG